MLSQYMLLVGTNVVANTGVPMVVAADSRKLNGLLVSAEKGQSFVLWSERNGTQSSGCIVSTSRRYITLFCWVSLDKATCPGVREPGAAPSMFCLAPCSSNNVTIDFTHMM